MRQKSCYRCGKAGLLSYAVKCPECGGGEFSTSGKRNSYSSARRTPESRYSSPVKSVLKYKSPQRNPEVVYINHVLHQRVNNDVLPLPIIDPVFDVEAPAYRSLTISPKTSPRLRMLDTPRSTRATPTSLSRDRSVVKQIYADDFEPLQLPPPPPPPPPPRPPLAVNEMPSIPNRSPRRKNGTVGQMIIEECKQKSLIPSPITLSILSDEPYLIPNKKSDQRLTAAASVLVYDNTARRPVRLADYQDPRAITSPRNSLITNNRFGVEAI